MNEEKATAKPSITGKQNAPAEEKVVKVSLEHHQMLLSELREINQDENFNKKIGIRRYVEKLIEDYRKDCVADLKKEREGSEDWLRIEHKRKSPETPFFDWLKGEFEKNSPVAKGLKAKAVKEADSASEPNRSGRA